MSHPADYGQPRQHVGASCGYPEHEHAGWPEDENGDSTPVGCIVCPRFIPPVVGHP